MEGAKHGALQGASQKSGTPQKTRMGEPRTDAGPDPRAQAVRFAAIGDLHCTEASAGTLRPLFAQAAEAADALVLCGDLTDYGTVKEARILADELSVVSV